MSQGRRAGSFSPHLEKGIHGVGVHEIRCEHLLASSLFKGRGRAVLSARWSLGAIIRIALGLKFLVSLRKNFAIAVRLPVIPSDRSHLTVVGAAILKELINLCYIRNTFSGSEQKDIIPNFEFYCPISLTYTIIETFQAVSSDNSALPFSLGIIIRITILIRTSFTVLTPKFLEYWWLTVIRRI
jgi:hypothetical protein